QVGAVGGQAFFGRAKANLPRHRPRPGQIPAAGGEALLGHAVTDCFGKGARLGEIGAPGGKLPGGLVIGHGDSLVSRRCRTAASSGPDALPVPPWARLEGTLQYSGPLFSCQAVSC